MPLPRQELSDRQWKIIERHLPKRPNGPGRPTCNQREIIEGILWVLRTGARWRDVGSFAGGPSGVTCWRWLGRYQADGTWDRIWAASLKAMNKRVRLQMETMYADGTFAAGKKGGYISG
jgi:transposase